MISWGDLINQVAIGMEIRLKFFEFLHCAYSITHIVTSHINPNPTIRSLRSWGYLLVPAPSMCEKRDMTEIRKYDGYELYLV